MHLVKLYVGMGLAFFLLVLCINIPSYFMVFGDLRDISSTAMRSAKAEGGFMPRTLALIDEQVSNSRLEPDRLDVILYPGANEKVQKRSELGIKLIYRFPFDMVIFSSGIRKDLIVTAENTGVSLKFFK